MAQILTSPCFSLRTTCIKTLLVERCECDSNRFLRFLQRSFIYGDTLTRLPKQFLWGKVSAQKFKDALRSPRVKALMRDNIADDTLIEKSWDIQGRESGKHFNYNGFMLFKDLKQVKDHRCIKSSLNKKWYDKECRWKVAN